MFPNIQYRLRAFNVSQHTVQSMVFNVSQYCYSTVTVQGL